MRSVLILLVSLMTFYSGVLADFSESRSLNIPAADINRLKIDCGAGMLMVTGRDGLDHIEVEAEIGIEGMSERDAREFIEDYVQLELEKNGATARLTGIIENDSHNLWSLFRNHSGWIDLEVRVPKSITLEIEDGSGDISVEDLSGAIDISDGSGDIVIGNAGGEMRLADGSGEIRMRDIGGPIEISDGSGEIDIRGADGDIEINDGSGDIDVSRINGTVTVSDGSGEINIDGVEEDVEILSSGSGGENITNVDGRVRGDLDDYRHRRRHR